MDSEQKKKKKGFGFKLWSELSDLEALLFLKTSAKNEEGMSKAVYRTETPGGEVYAHTCECINDCFFFFISGLVHYWICCHTGLPETEKEREKQHLGWWFA